MLVVLSEMFRFKEN